MGWLHHSGAGDVDGICFGLLVVAGLFAGALCGSAERELLSVSGGSASEAWDSAPVAGGAGAGGHGVLFFFATGRDHDAGGDAHPDAVLLAARGRDAAAGEAAGAGAAIQDSLVS